MFESIKIEWIMLINFDSNKLKFKNDYHFFYKGISIFEIKGNIKNKIIIFAIKIKLMIKQ